MNNFFIDFSRFDEDQRSYGFKTTFLLPMCDTHTHLHAQHTYSLQHTHKHTHSHSLTLHWVVSKGFQKGKEKEKKLEPEKRKMTRQKRAGGRI